MLRVATASGVEVVTLVPPLTVTGATRASLADIGPGTYLGTAARAQPDGSFRALEVHIFAESMRGTGEGHRPMEAPGTTMTNASVDALVQRADGPLLTLKHKDGVTQVLVPPDAPIVRFGPGDQSLLVPGASIVVFRAIRAARRDRQRLAAHGRGGRHAPAHVSRAPRVICYRAVIHEASGLPA